MGKEWLYHLGSHSNRSSTKRGKTSSSRGQFRDGSSSSSSTRTSSTSFSGCMNAIFQLFDLHRFHFPNLHPQQPSSSSSSSFNPPHDFFLPQLQPPIYLKGVEAPRNSLEMDDTSFVGAPTSISSNSTMKQRDTNKIPMGGIQIKTSGSSRRTTDLNGLSSSECVYSSNSSSPAGTKTPTLVARLMGIDLLPETSSPRLSSSSSVSNLSSSKSQLHRVQNPRKKQKNDDVMMASHSLPNTPRISSARRSDVVDQRFSLQINKENNNNELATSQEFEFSKFLTTKIAAAAAADRRSKGDETMSPGHYAKQIVQQFKENVSRRIGRDITNTVENNRSEQRRDQHVLLLKSKKPPSSNIGDCHGHDHDQSTAPNSCSPRLRFLENKNKTSHSPEFSTPPLSPFTDTAQSKSATVATSKPKAQTESPKEEQQQIMTQQSSRQKCKKNDREMLHRARLKRPLVRIKKEESFVRSSSATSSTLANANHFLEKKKCKQIPLSNVSQILSVKKDPSPPATRLPQQQEERKKYDQSSKVFDYTLLSRKSTELPSCSSQSYKQEPNSIITVTDINSNGGTTTVSSTTGSDELIEYISRLLECTGIHEFTPVSFNKWYSPSHPLDPSLFHNLRFSYPKLELNCEKLVFDVVEELLAEILRPLTNLKPWVNWTARNDHILMYGWQLIDTLFARIRSFPSADCRVLEDIDAVVGKDLGSGGERSSSAVAAFEEEGDGIVIEIEGDILDNLVHEMVVWCSFGVRTR